MANTRNIFITVLLSFSLLSCATVKKPVWLKAVHKQVPGQFCQQFSRKMMSPTLQKNKQVQQECLTVAKQVLQTCLQKHQAQLPAVFTNSNKDKWGGLLSQCMVDSVYKSQKLPIYTHQEFKQQVFAKRSYVATRAACRSERMLQYLRSRPQTSKQCTARLNAARPQCAKESLHEQPTFIRGMKKTTILAKQYMHCLVDKTFKLPEHIRKGIIQS